MSDPVWLERRRQLDARRGVDATVVRQLAGQARRFADATGTSLDLYDVLQALDDTGLLLVVDSEGVASDAAKWAVLVIAADPLDLDTATDGVDSHWDREQQGRDEAAMRPTRRRHDRTE